MVKLKGLGRGLDALLANDDDNTPSDALKMLDVLLMQAGQYQPRSYMDEAALQTLADSIQAQGMIQPILVRPIEDGRYEIIAVGAPLKWLV